MRQKSRRLRDCAGGESKFNWEYPKVWISPPMPAPADFRGLLIFLPIRKRWTWKSGHLWPRNVGIERSELQLDRPYSNLARLDDEDVAGAVSRCPLGT